MCYLRRGYERFFQTGFLNGIKTYSIRRIIERCMFFQTGFLNGIKTVTKFVKPYRHRFFRPDF